MAGTRLDLKARWADPALTVLTVELAVAMFILVPLGVLAPRTGLVFTLVLSALIAPLLIAAVLVASSNRAATAAIFVAIALFVAGLVPALRGPGTLGPFLHLLGTLLMGCALIWVVARVAFAAGRVTPHRLMGTLLLYLMIGATFAGLYGTLALLLPHPFAGMPPREDGAAVVPTWCTSAS